MLSALFFLLLTRMKVIIVLSAHKEQQFIAVYSKRSGCSGHVKNGLSRGNKTAADCVDSDVNTVSVRMMKAGLHLDYSFYRLTMSLRTHGAIKMFCVLW